MVKVKPQDGEMADGSERTTAGNARKQAKTGKAIVYPPEGTQVCGQPNCAYFDAKARSMRDYRIKFLYDEYKEACDRQGLVALKPNSFSTTLTKWRRDEAVGKAPAWFPGELMQTYWTRLLPSATGLPKRIDLFVAYLPCSGISYLRACENTSFMTWMRCCAAAYRSLGGVPHVTEHRLASRETARHTGEMQRTTLQAFAAHYRTVLLRPQLKREGEIDEALRPLVLKRYTAATKFVRDNIVTTPDATVEEIDAQVIALTDEHNRTRRGTKPSALEVFEAEEAPQLLALPERDYGMAVWTERRIDEGYHFDWNRMRYSVPWQLAGEKVRVRALDGAVEAYSMGRLVARHGIPKSPSGKGLVTDPSHRPPAHQGFANRLEERFMGLALEHGPATGAVMRELVEQCKRDGGCWRPCKDLLDLARMPSAIKLEEACAQVLERDMPLATASAAQVMHESTR